MGHAVSIGINLRFISSHDGDNQKGYTYFKLIASIVLLFVDPSKFMGEVCCSERSVLDAGLPPVKG